MTTCPVCRKGVLESIAYFELKSGPINMVMSRLPPINIPAITIEICSREPCNYMRLGAAPGSLSLAKSKLRGLMLTQPKLP